MINILEDHIWRSLPEHGGFSTNPNLRKKVDETGAFLPFYGNTTVFLLDEGTKQTLHEIRQELYRAAGWMLSEPLDPATFHMTLHDLINAPVWDQELAAKMAEAEHKAKALLHAWKDQPPLRMRTTWLFNMVNTSIVLGLAPADGDSWRRLDEMYGALESVVHLGYGLTPHITMAYYRPGTYSQQELDALRSALRPVELEIEAKMEDLVFQNFCHMNLYTQEDLPQMGGIPV